MDKISNEFIKELLDYLFDSQEVEGIYVDEYSSSPYYLIRGEGSESSRVYPINEEIDEFLGYKFCISCGATKMGIVFEDLDEVIKINLTGSLLACVPEEVSNDEIYDDYDNYEYNLYKHANDYIKLGEKMRNEVGNKIKDILLPHEYRLDYNGISVYTQPKIDLYCCARNSREIVVSDKKMIESATKCTLEPCFIQALINYYNLNEEDLQELDFPDMNYANYGFLPSGVPVINDWEGYWE